ncbi:MAG: hypothetical protein ACREHD_00940, partial [Pirellulales bacterium]
GVPNDLLKIAPAVLETSQGILPALPALAELSSPSAAGPGGSSSTQAGSTSAAGKGLAHN